MLALNAGSADNLIAYQINTDDAENDPVLETFTNSSGQTFVLSGGTEDGIALWTLSGSGQLTFQNARAEDEAESADTDPQGNDLGPDLIAPYDTALNDINAGAFFEVDGLTCLVTGDEDHSISIFGSMKTPSMAMAHLT